MQFIDEVRIRVEAGHGGSGCIAFRREKFVPRGGPSGGDGGDGGSVVMIGSLGVNTLYQLRHNSLLRAERGRHGEGSNKTGRSGDDYEVPVPLGTIVFDEDQSTVVGEITAAGQRLVVARGGQGGRGNARFATAVRQAPRFAQPGEEGDERWIRCELKLLADVGVVGLPNAGKSTLISSITAARPKIADYPFTTLVPQLGVVARGPLDEPFVIADLPGLIRGASEGAGLGFRFLRHIERCRVLVHLVDLAVGEVAADEELAMIEHELENFDASLMQRPRFIVGTKIDARDEERSAQLRAAAEARDLPYFEISSVTHDGVDRLVSELGQLLEQIPVKYMVTLDEDDTARFDNKVRKSISSSELPASESKSSGSKTSGSKTETPVRRLTLDSFEDLE